MHVIALAQQKGGVGKSAAAIHLACQATACREKAALVDLDIEQGTTSKWFDRRDGKDEPSVYSADATNLKEILDKARKDGVKWCFLDLPGRSQAISGAGIAACDFIIVPSRPLEIDIEASLDTVKRAKRAKKPYAYLMNIVPGQGDKRRATQVSGFLRAHGHTVTDTIIVQRIEVPDAISQGLAVNEVRPGSPSSKEYAKLFRWIKKKVGKND